MKARDTVRMANLLMIVAALGVVGWTLYQLQVTDADSLARESAMADVSRRRQQSGSHNTSSITPHRVRRVAEPKSATPAGNETPKPVDSAKPAGEVKSEPGASTKNQVAAEKQSPAGNPSQQGGTVAETAEADSNARLAELLKGRSLGKSTAASRVRKYSSQTDSAEQKKAPAGVKSRVRVAPSKGQNSVADQIGL